MKNELLQTGGPEPENMAQTVERIVRENEEMRRGLGDIAMFLHCYQKGKLHECVKNSNDQVELIFAKLAMTLPNKNLS